MLDIMRVFACLSQRLSTTELRQLTRFTEGFDTKDLQEAKVLLEALA
jgi:hypothetical protein